MDPDRDGGPWSERARDDDPQHERRRRARELRASRRRTRASLSRLGVLALRVQLASRTDVPGLCRSRPQLRGTALLRLARANADPSRSDPTGPGSGLREVGARDSHASRLRRLLAAPEPQSPCALGPLSRPAHTLRRRLVRFLHSGDLPELRVLRAGGRRPVRALVGPWTHGNKTVELSYAGDVEFGRDAALPSFDELHLRWFDRWLRGVDNGLDHEASLRIFVMGGGSGRRSSTGRLVHGGRWRDEQEWPLARTRFT